MLVEPLPTTENAAEPSADRPSEAIETRYREVRAATEELCRPLAVEDYVIQSMPDASPAKWHLAHTSWFFEAMVIGPHAPDYRVFHPRFAYLFNSYYVTLGQRHCRAQRGLLSRPTVEEVYRYRKHVDEQMLALLGAADGARLRQIAGLVEIGLHHEQQHQELLLTDLKHLFGSNPLRPAYHAPVAATSGVAPPPLRWLGFGEDLAWIGHDGEGFAYDNERPRHRVFLEAFEIASRLVTNGEYLAFIEDGGYERPNLWLSDGWAACQEGGWRSPLYWETNGRPHGVMTLAGMHPLVHHEPVCHVSYYEADAYARWAGARLPREEEWEAASRKCRIAGNFAERNRFHPAPAERDAAAPAQMFGDAWEWTASAYLSYPGYRPPEGALSEYNAKFMCNQFVLRGGSCVTPQSHIRRTYRNFFPPGVRWQFSGIRLARDV